MLLPPGRHLLTGLCVATAALPALARQPQRSYREGGTMTQFTTLNGGLGALPLLTDARTRSISAENPTGEKGKGGMAIPDPSEPKPAAAARARNTLSSSLISPKPPVTPKRGSPFAVIVSERRHAGPE